MSGDLTGWLEKENPSHAYTGCCWRMIYTASSRVSNKFFFFFEVKNCHFATSYSVENLKTFEFCEETNSPKTLHAFTQFYYGSVGESPVCPFSLRCQDGS